MQPSTQNSKIKRWNAAEGDAVLIIRDVDVAKQDGTEVVVGWTGQYVSGILVRLSPCKVTWVPGTSSASRASDQEPLTARLHRLLPHQSLLIIQRFR